MTYIQNLYTSRDNKADGSTYVGQTGRLWWNPDTNSLYYSDGTTPGGIAVGAGGNPFNQILNTTSSVTFANINITDTANLTNLNVSGNINFATTGNIDLGNLVIFDQTIAGTVSGRDINLIPLNVANVNIGGGFNVHSSGNLETIPVFAVENSGKVTVLVTDVANSTGAVEIVGSTDGVSVTEGNPGVILHMTGADGIPSRVYNDGVNNYPIYIGRRYNGTALAPTGVLQNQVINRIGANPYLTDSPGFTPLGVARIDFVATENQTTTAQGSRIVLTVTPTGSNTSASVATFDTSGIILTGNLLPSTDDLYSLGNSSLRWVAAHFGNAGIYIQDNTLGDDGQLQLDNGTLNFDNIDSLRVGNLQFTSTGIITTIDPALDVLIGNPGDTGNTVIRNAGIKFTDGTIQTTAAIPLAQKGNALGVVPLNASTKIDPIYLPAGAVTFKGVWDAANNSPTLADGTGTIGDEYIVGVAGNIDLGSGNINFSVGDFALYSTGNVWVDIPVGGAGVDTFNGRSGIVTLLSGDVTNALSNGSIVNSKLQNPNVTITTGTGLDGGQVVPLGGTITLTNTGVTGAVAGTGVAVSAATGNVTFSIGQAVGTASTVQFAAISSTTTIQATGNITGGNLVTGGRVVATGNIVTLGNIVTPGSVINSGVFTTGNVTGNYFIGNGSLLTGLNAYGNVFANGTAMTAGNGSATLTVTPGNNQVIIGNNTSKVLTIAVNDNPTFANVSVTGNITVAGNILTAGTTYLANIGNILFANSAPLPTAQPGIMEYDGRVLYFTPQDQERGVIPNQQWYVLNADRGLTYGAITAQSLFGVGAHVSNSTRYWFRIKATVSRSAGTNNTALTLGWQGDAVLSKLSYTVQSSIGTSATPLTGTTFETVLVSNFTNQATVTGTSNPPDVTNLVILGMVDVGATGAGTFNPYISWTGATPAGSVTVSSLSNFQIYPVGATGANTNVGNWS